jgi:hypothetical protein
MRTIIAIGTLFSMGLVLSGCAFGSSQDASDQPAANDDVAASTNRTCTYNADTGEQLCYASFTEALAAATGGKIIDAPPDAKTAVNDAELTERINALGAVPRTAMKGAPSARSEGAESIATSSAALQNIGNPSGIPLAVFWRDCNFSGDAMVTFGSRACTTPTTDTDFYVYWVGSANNDTLSSFRGYNNCAAALYKDANFGGDSSLYRTEWSCFYSNLNDAVSSFTLS